jgi:hypothetical protein
MTLFLLFCSFTLSIKLDAVVLVEQVLDWPAGGSIQVVSVGSNAQTIKTAQAHIRGEG